MEALTISSFRYGVDTRRTELTSQPGTLLTCENGHITPGGTIEKRFGFIAFSDLSTIVDTLADQGTFGFQETDSGPMVFGSALVFGTTPTFSQPVLNAALPTTSPQIVYQQLQHPEIVDMVNAIQTGIAYSRTVHRMTAVAFSVAFEGKSFVGATFADGRTYLYYNGTLVDSSRNGVVLTNETSLNAMGRDLARQGNTLSGWKAFPNGDVHTGGTAMATQAATGLGSGATITTVVTAGMVTTATVVTGGSGYAVGDFIYVQDTTGSGAIVKVATLTGTAVATVTVFYAGIIACDGVDVLVSPAQQTFTPLFPPNSSQTAISSAAGLVGATEIDQADPGILAVAATAAFLIGAGAGGNTITVTAPATAAAQTPAVTLASAIAWNTSAIQTATDVVAAINRQSMFTGYVATNLSTTGIATATVNVIAPSSFGNFALNLTVTGTVPNSAGTVFVPFALRLNPNNLSITVPAQPGIVKISGKITAAVVGNAGPVTFTWTFISTGEILVLRAGQECQFSVHIAVPGGFASGSGYCEADDGVSKDKVRFTVYFKRLA